MPDWNGNRQTNLICDAVDWFSNTAIANATAGKRSVGGVKNRPVKKVTIPGNLLPQHDAYATYDILFRYV